MMGKGRQHYIAICGEGSTSTISTDSKTTAINSFLDASPIPGINKTGVLRKFNDRKACITDD
jgi:hypothetical protein